MRRDLTNAWLVISGLLFIFMLVTIMTLRGDYYFCPTVVLTHDRCLAEGTYSASVLDDARIIRGRIHYADGTVTVSRDP